jgi:hypothetical protein
VGSFTIIKQPKGQLIVVGGVPPGGISIIVIVPPGPPITSVPPGPIGPLGGVPCGGIVIILLPTITEQVAVSLPFFTVTV